ncbi:MAG TPA: DNA ligase D [Stellaceae bacterium]|nr:DNA ligase D [Stellaceae bacterium]
MALEEYQRKRDFRLTPEPAGGRVAPKRKAAALAFVIQKHRARRLHYDFRLELDGVLKSWAVPKGPSLDPGEKRLAVHVEDHPIEYGGFEGVIPEGQYGGGTVLLWDRGTWQPLDGDPDEAYRKGTLKFALHGEKLHGNWVLVRMGGRAAKEAHENWLLIKERDEAAQPGSGSAVVDDNPESVDTGRTMDAIAADRDRVWESNRAPEESAPAPKKRNAAKRAGGGSALAKAALPENFTPQLATLAERVPDGDDWLHEIKYDGYRLLARIERGEVRLLTRNGLDWTAKFPAVARAFAELPVGSALIDGELVYLTPEGRTNFALLQDQIASGQTGGLNFMAFDLLHHDGQDLTGTVLEERKDALAELIPPDAQGQLRYSDHQQGSGSAFFREVCKFGLEGIVSKRRDRPYRAGRSRDWLKIKCVNREEFVVVGFTEPDGQRLGFGALLLAYYDANGALHYAGRVGTGFNTTQLLTMRRQFQALERRKPPVTLPKGISAKDTHWLEPRLVAEVQFSNWTADRIVRHATFLGLREDKPAEEVVLDPEALPQVAASAAADGESPRPSLPRPRGRAGAAGGEPASTGRHSRESGNPEQAPRRPPLGPRVRGGDSEGAPVGVALRDGSVEFAGVRLTHPGRELYPDKNITKLDLAKYYAAIADWVLPHLANRALSLVRCPDGIGGQTFYQKHLSNGVPDTLGRIEITEGTGTDIYLWIKDLSSLIGLVQISAIEIHPWGSTVEKLETPDLVTFDFDPDVGLPWERVTAAAIEMREALLGIGLRSFPKTTGGKGLHVVVPLTPKLGWDEVKAFAKWVADRFVSEYPDRFTANMAKRARTGRIFIDYLRNGRGATAIGAYSPRARPGAPVAMPLSWEEVEAGVHPGDFTIETVPARLADLKADPWAELRRVRQSISAAVRRQVGI